MPFKGISTLKTPDRPNYFITLCKQPAMPPDNAEFLWKRWLKLLQNIETTHLQQQTLFSGLLKRYTERNRVYHNTTHLLEIFTLLDEFAPQITQPDAVDWAVFYHDAVYHALKKDNEPRSAQLANKVMTQLKLPQPLIAFTEQLIWATQNHIAPLPDINLHLFLDADLAILGAAPGKYAHYAQAIRTEYKIVPDFMYQPGRKRVLQHLLNKPTLYYTPQMQARFEKQARINMQQELSRL